MMFLSALFGLTLVSQSYAHSLVDTRNYHAALNARVDAAVTGAVNPPVLGPVGDLNIVNRDISPDGFTRSTVLAGGIFPGPLIVGEKGDSFQINVIDQLTDDSMLMSTTIHWHGIYQNKTNENDGTAFVTQCPISANHSYLYEWRSPHQAGTYWYHSHLSTQYCDGLRGPLVIYDPDDHYIDWYDVDDASTIITLADWYQSTSTYLNEYITGIVDPNSTLINGLGRYAGGPLSPLAVIEVEQGKRYRFRVIGLSCSSAFNFTIDGHPWTVIEADGNPTQPLLADSTYVYPGQRYSIILNATQPIDNYWIRANTRVLNGSVTEPGFNMAILRYKGAPDEDPTTNESSIYPLSETDLHALDDPAAPGVPGLGNADVNLVIDIAVNGGIFSMNNQTYIPPTVPVLLQILSGARTPSELLPTGSLISLPLNKVIEVSLPAFKDVTAVGTLPHPMHLHGHSFSVVSSAGSDVYNYANPVRRDTVSIGVYPANTTIRFVTDNSGPWFLHCHIDWHLEAGFAMVFGENIDGVPADLGPLPGAWDDLCPEYDGLTQQQLGGIL